MGLGVKPLQFVTTKTALGQYKICVMDLKNGEGQTLQNYRGGYIATVMRFAWLLFQLRAP
jgi:hypothetical protein